MKRKAEKGKSWFQAMLVLLFMVCTYSAQEEKTLNLLIISLKHICGNTEDVGIGKEKRICPAD